MEKLIPDAAVQAIQDSAKVELITVDEEVYTSRPVFLPPAEPTAETLKLDTLTGLLEYIGNDFDGAIENGALVHVAAHDKVRVVSSIYGRHSRRDVFAVAEAEPCEFRFDCFMDLEQFIIELQSKFDQREDWESVLRVVGNIKEENVHNTSDDGISQTVVARAGIARVEEVQVPNPVTLRPYRTFREVEQPASLFVLRMKQGREGQMPQVALFEADGGKWKLTAIEAIRDYLKEANSEVTIIA